MSAVEFVPGERGFTLLVRPAGWYSQRLTLMPGTIVTGIASLITCSIIWGNFKINNRVATPADLVWILPIWVVGIALLAAALQVAYKKIVFTADDAQLVIASAGPLGRSERRMPRGSLEAALVSQSSIQVNGRSLMQLKLYFGGQSKPLTCMTGRNEFDIGQVAHRLTEALALKGNSVSARQGMQLREAPIHAHIFKIICGVGVGVGLVVMALNRVIGITAAALIFILTIIAAIIAIAVIMRKARCPQCGETIRRDGLSGNGNYQYTCSACRVIWQSPVRVGGPRR